jgi:hypothetical protein
MASNIGLSFTGLLLGWILDLIVQIAEKGPRVWRHYEWREAVIVALVSIPVAFYLRARVRKGIRARAGDRETS